MMELEHVGIAVRDAKSALLLMDALVGVKQYKSEVVEAEGVRTYFLRAGETKLELLEALDDDSPIARHIEKRGPGIHHLAFEVNNLEAELDRLTEAGFSVIGTPRPGADGKRIFFVHPLDTQGVLYEICRQSRSILQNATVSIGGQRPAIRRSDTNGPVSLVVGEIPVEIEALARRLEQSTQVVVAVDESSSLSGLIDALQFDAVHLIVSSSRLSKLVAAEGSIVETNEATPLDTSVQVESAEMHKERVRVKDLDARVQSIIVLIDEPTAVSLVGRPTLVAARPPAAAAAIALYERSPGTDLAVGSDELLARAIETHIRRHAKT